MIGQAQVSDLQDLTDLFNQYRLFYGRESDAAGAKIFLKDLLSKNLSIIYLYRDNDGAAGFTQIYTSFSSVSMAPIWILNDLYVDQRFRRQGVAKSLLKHVFLEAKCCGVKRVILETQIENTSAKSVYEGLGMIKNVSVDMYYKDL